MVSTGQKKKKAFSSRLRFWKSSKPVGTAGLPTSIQFKGTVDGLWWCIHLEIFSPGLNYRTIDTSSRPDDTGRWPEHDFLGWLVDNPKETSPEC